MIVRRAIPQTLPLFVPEAADETIEFQLNAIVDRLEPLRKPGHTPGERSPPIRLMHLFSPRIQADGFLHQINTIICIYLY